MTPSFFLCPPELRLEIYRLLLTDVIADGKPADAAGLLMSSRSVFEELSVDFVSKVQPILNIQKAWEAARPNKSPLKIVLPRDYTFALLPTEAVATTTIVDMPGWGKGNYDWYTRGADRKMFLKFLDRLLPIMCHPWSNFTMRIHLPPPDTYWPRHSWFHLSKFLFQIMNYYEDHDALQDLTGSRRVILCLEDCESEAFDVEEVAKRLSSPLEQRECHSVTEEPRTDECKKWIRRKSYGGRVDVELGFPIGRW